MKKIIHTLWGRSTISFLNKLCTKNTIVQRENILYRQSCTISTNSKTTSNTPISSIEWINAFLDKKRSISPLTPKPLYQLDNNNNVILLAQFYRSLKTQDMNKIWPIYTTLYQYNLHKNLTRNNYRQLIQLSSRQKPPSEKHLSRFLMILEDMQQQGYKIRLSEYSQIISWVGGKTVPISKPKHVNEALEWFRLMEEDNVQPSLVTFNTLIHITSKAKDILTAQRLYHAMLAKGIEADQFTYTTLIHSMALMGDAQGVYDMVSRLEEKGQQSFLNHTVAWNILLTCYYDASLAEKINEVEKLNENEKLNEDEKTNEDEKKENPYSFFINFEKIANKMFNEMINATLISSPGSSSSLIKNTTPKADSITFQIHIDYLLKQGNRNQAIHVLLDTMPHMNIQPTITIYNHLFASFMNPSDLGDEHKSQLHQLYQSLTSNQSHLKINSTTLYTLVNALLDVGDTSFALETFVQLCQQYNLSPDEELLDRLQQILPTSQDIQVIIIFRIRSNV
ncbi:unnamed protein product [Cunninghamella blakesleeana]